MNGGGTWRPWIVNMHILGNKPLIASNSRYKPVGRMASWTSSVILVETANRMDAHLVGTSVAKHAVGELQCLPYHPHDIPLDPAAPLEHCLHPPQPNTLLRPFNRLDELIDAATDAEVD